MRLISSRGKQQTLSVRQVHTASLELSLLLKMCSPIILLLLRLLGPRKASLLWLWESQLVLVLRILATLFHHSRILVSLNHDAWQACACELVEAQERTSNTKQCRCYCPKGCSGKGEWALKGTDLSPCVTEPDLLLLYNITGCCKGQGQAASTPEETKQSGPHIKAAYPPTSWRTW